MPLNLKHIRIANLYKYYILMVTINNTQKYCSKNLVWKNDPMIRRLDEATLYKLSGNIPTLDIFLNHFTYRKTLPHCKTGIRWKNLCFWAWFVLNSQTSTKLFHSFGKTNILIWTCTFLPNLRWNSSYILISILPTC